jgi:hypothetical protein
VRTQTQAQDRNRRHEAREDKFADAFDTFDTFPDCAIFLDTSERAAGYVGAAGSRTGKGWEWEVQACITVVFRIHEARLVRIEFLQ